VVVFLCLVPVTGLRAQQTSPPEPAPKHTPTVSQPAPEKPKPSFKLTVKTRPILNISLKAEKAKISEVAQELSQRLKVPVFLGPQRQNELITIEFSELTLEPALQLMSHAVYVDYEIDTGSLEPPKPLGVFFYDLNQGEPPLTAVVSGSTQSLLIEGDTEDGVELQTEEDKKRAAEQSLRVSFKNNLLSIKAKDQPLQILLLKLGQELGVPVDIQDEAPKVVNAEISKLSVEDAIRQLAPNIRMFVRADLTRAERRVLRLVLAEAKMPQPNP
jgi:hypothetical protein